MPETSDTDRAAERSVFAVDGPGDDVVREPEPRSDESAPAKVAKRRFDLRRTFQDHPLATVAIGVGAIGLGIIGYRAVRFSLPVRLLLALRFGRVRELWRP